MTLIKQGEALSFNTDRVYQSDTVIPSIFNKLSDDSEIITQFKKVAENLKQIAPKAKDFLYFSAIMMHAAEAALLDSDGNLKKDSSGKDLTSTWAKDGESWKWVCSSKLVQPYKNSNNDIFPEEELIKAHKKWVGRPLCLDHKSSSVDMIRGVIVDTYYDYAKKRVVALCALDKVNYPDLARKVSTGVAASVSMGTAVGKAICTEDGCHQVARIEAEFCEHMRRKNGYGEINVDLNPIELSIVVNGADPQAKIRHIVAASDSIATYVNMKKNQLNKLAEDETRDIELATEIASGLEKTTQDLLSLKEKIEQLKSNEEAEQLQQEETGTEKPKVEASTQDLDIKHISSVLNSLMNRMGELDEKFNKLFKNGEDLHMTDKRAFFQGGGGVNEPTPGKPKYPKEEADKIRDTQDTHMNSAVDTGPVDGLFPGDEQKKRELLRLADVQARELKRQAALKAVSESLRKGAFFQGGGGANEPTPGKPKYPKEEADKIRETQDAHMTGASPFPGVGKIDGLYDKDLDAKKKLLRAKLTAKFIKAAKLDGSLDLGESRWQVYADDKLILTATVNEITGKKAESLYSSIATKEFGINLISKIKSEGFEKAASLYKGAQAAESTPAPATSAPAADNAEPSNDSAFDQGKSGEPKEMISDISHQLANLSADLSQASESLNEAPTNELQSFDELAGSAPEGMPAVASTIALINMQKKISNALIDGIQQTQDQIKDHIQELKLAHMLVSDKDLMKTASSEKKQTISDMVKDACDDSKRTIADGVTLMKAFVKYASGTIALVKRANKEISFMKTAQEMTMPEDKITAKPPAAPKPAAPKPAAPKPAPSGAAYKAPAPKPVAPKPAPPAEPTAHNYGLMSSEDRMKALNHTLKRDPSSHAPVGITTPDAKGYEAKTPGQPSNLSVTHHSGNADAHKAEDGENDKDKDDVGDLKVGPDGAMEGTPDEVGKAMKAKDASFDLKTKEGRAAYRSKLAGQGLTFSDMLNKAHGKGGFTPSFEIKPTGDLAKVETLEETHKAMMDVANDPVKIRKAEEIQKHIVAGNINPDTDFPGLIAQGLDSDAVKYWKSMWGQAKDGGSDFATKLVQDYSNKKIAEEQNAYKVKVARAYALANEMADKGMIGKDASSLNTQVTEMLEWNDQSFDSMKKMVSRQAVVKKASIPQVGILGNEMNIPAPEAAPSDLRNQLDAVFNSSWKPRW
jgi:hypothetical protein